MRKHLTRTLALLLCLLPWGVFASEGTSPNLDIPTKMRQETSTPSMDSMVALKDTVYPPTRRASCLSACWRRKIATTRKRAPATPPP